MAHPEQDWDRFSYLTGAGPVDFVFDSGRSRLAFCVAQVPLGEGQSFTLTHAPGLLDTPDSTTTTATFRVLADGLGSVDELSLTLPLIADEGQTISTALTHYRGKLLVGAVGLRIDFQMANLENAFRLVSDGFQGVSLNYFGPTNRLQLEFTLAARRHFLTLPVPKHDYLWRKTEAILRRQPTPEGVRIVAYKLGFDYVSYPLDPYQLP